MRGSEGISERLDVMAKVYIAHEVWVITELNFQKPSMNQGISHISHIS